MASGSASTTVEALKKVEAKRVAGAPTIVKIGGSLLSPKGADFSELEKPDLKPAKRVGRWLADELKPEDKVIIISGAGFVGHSTVIKYKLTKLDENQHAWALLRQYVTRTARIIVDELLERNIAATHIAAMNYVTQREGMAVDINASSIGRLCDSGFTVVTNADGALDDSLGLSIISSDEIARGIANRLDSSMVVHLTNVRGVLERKQVGTPPKTTYHLIRELKMSEIGKVEFWDVADDVTGGMKRKVTSLLRLDKADALVMRPSRGALRKVLDGKIDQVEGTHVINDKPKPSGV